MVKCEADRTPPVCADVMICGILHPLSLFSYVA